MVAPAEVDPRNGQIAEETMKENENSFDIDRCDGCGGPLTKREQLSGLCSRCEQTVLSGAKNPRKTRKPSRERERR